MSKNITNFFIILILVFCMLFTTKIHASDLIIEETANMLKLSDMIDSLNEYKENSEIGKELELDDIAQNLITGKNTDYSKIVQKVLDIFASNVISVLKNGIAILVVIVLIGIFSSLELDKSSTVSKITFLISYIIIVTILANMYVGVIESYRETISILTAVMQTVTPFVMIVMVFSGGIVSSNLIQPMILFIASLVGFLINYIVIPFVTIAIVIKIVSSFSDKVRLNRLGDLFSKSGLWITSVVFTLFLSVISVKGSITTSVDSTVIKTTQTAVSNFIPVVGKFVSDSLESIMGATEVIGKTAGVIGIIVMCVVTITPIIQMLVIFLAHKVLAALAETLTDNKNTIGIIDSFAETYKVLLGVLIGVLALFVMSSGVLIKLIGNIT